MSEHEQLLREIARWTHAEIAAGRAPGVVRDELIRRGVTEEVAARVVEAAVEVRNDSLARNADGLTGSTLLPWVGIAIVYLLINGVLYVGQELLARDDVYAVEQMEAVMNDLERQLLDIERQAS